MYVPQACYLNNMCTHTGCPHGGNVLGLQCDVSMSDYGVFFCLCKGVPHRRWLNNYPPTASVLCTALSFSVLSPFLLTFFFCAFTIAAHSFLFCFTFFFVFFSIQLCVYFQTFLNCLLTVGRDNGIGFGDLYIHSHNFFQTLFNIYNIYHLELFKPGVGNPRLFHPSAVAPCSVGVQYAREVSPRLLTLTLHFF